MNKNNIKIIKRLKGISAENIESPSQIRQQEVKAESDTQREMVDVVNSWIDERDANRQTEEFAALDNLLTWKTVSDHTELLIPVNKKKRVIEGNTTAQVTEMSEAE